ncbi:MAG: hypothetical protein U9N35_05735 [Euryarchaeota archaeon]|nr:hypothetical protein [Euryarchaeota archaeon]
MRNRWMYKMTGLPGWMRFGFSPGWVGRSPNGLPPGAQYMMQTGQVQQFADFMGASQTPIQGTYAPQSMTEEQKMAMLGDRAKIIEQELKQIKERVEELKNTRNSSSSSFRARNSENSLRNKEAKK